MVLVDPSLLSADSLARASIILAVGLLLLFSSVITICVLLNNPNMQEVMSTYLISLAFADLLCAIFIVPLSVYSALSPNWDFMGDNSMLCKCASYLHVTLISSTIYTFAWIAVDRYSAFMKPARYEIEHTLTRCKFWIVFSWVTAILSACPMIVAKMEVNYYREFEMCVLNWQTTIAYSITLAVLVLLPTTCTVAFSIGSIFTAMNKPEELEDSQKSIIETDENFIITLFVLIAFILAWLPIIVIQFLPSYLIHPADSATMKFAFMWLAIGGSSSKLLIYTFTNREFRRSMCSYCVRPFCRRRRGSDSDFDDDLVVDNCQRYRNVNNNNNNNTTLQFCENDASVQDRNNYALNSGSGHQQQLQRHSIALLDDNKQSRPSSIGCCCCHIFPRSANSSPTNMVGNMPEYGSFARNQPTYY